MASPPVNNATSASERDRRMQTGAIIGHRKVSDLSSFAVPIVIWVIDEYSLVSGWIH